MNTTEDSNFTDGEMLRLVAITQGRLGYRAALWSPRTQKMETEQKTEKNQSVDENATNYKKDALWREAGKA